MPYFQEKMPIPALGQMTTNCHPGLGPLRLNITVFTTIPQKRRKEISRKMIEVENPKASHIQKYYFTP